MEESMCIIDEVKRARENREKEMAVLGVEYIELRDRMVFSDEIVPSNLTLFSQMGRIANSTDDLKVKKSMRNKKEF